MQMKLLSNFHYLYMYKFHHYSIINLLYLYMLNNCQYYQNMFRMFHYIKYTHRIFQYNQYHKHNFHQNLQFLQYLNKLHIHFKCLYKQHMENYIVNILRLCQHIHPYKYINYYPQFYNHYHNKQYMLLQLFSMKHKVKCMKYKLQQFFLILKDIHIQESTKHYQNKQCNYFNCFYMQNIKYCIVYIKLNRLKNIHQRISYKQFQ